MIHVSQDQATSRCWALPRDGVALTALVWPGAVAGWHAFRCRRALREGRIEDARVAYGRLLEAVANPDEPNEDASASRRRQLLLARAGDAGAQASVRELVLDASQHEEASWAASFLAERGDPVARVWLQREIAREPDPETELDSCKCYRVLGHLFADDADQVAHLAQEAWDDPYGNASELCTLARTAREVPELAPAVRDHITRLLAQPAGRERAAVALLEVGAIDVDEVVFHWSPTLAIEEPPLSPLPSGVPPWPRRDVARDLRWQVATALDRRGQPDALAHVLDVFQEAVRRDDDSGSFDAVLYLLWDRETPRRDLVVPLLRTWLASHPDPPRREFAAFELAAEGDGRDLPAIRALLFEEVDLDSDREARRRVDAAACVLRWLHHHRGGRTQ